MINTNKICVHAIVSGHVQGVFYRDSTRKQAHSLNIKGWVKNRDDGTVEVMACGKNNDVQKLMAWLWEGPPASSVSHVETQKKSWEEYKDFQIKY